MDYMSFIVTCVVFDKNSMEMLYSVKQAEQL